MNKIFKHKRGASGLKVVCEFAKSHCSSGEKTAVNSGAHVSTRSGFKSLSIALISALTLGIATPAMAVVFGEAGNKGGATANGAGSTAGGYNAKALGNSSTAIGMNAESLASQTLAVGIFARAKGDQSTAIGNDVVSLGASSIAIGSDDISSVYKNNPLFTAEELTKKDIVDELDKLCAIANCQNMYGLKKVGSVYVTVEDDIVNNAPKYRQWSPTFTTGAGAIAIGSRTVAMSDGATAIGTLAVAAGKKSAALGSFSKATAENALAFGAESIASGINSSVFGIGAKASKNNSMAIGTGAVSNIENSIALGVNSKTDYTGSDKRGYMPGNGYMLPMASSAGVISVGSATQPRRIVNLASGALDTDAVNVAQLKSLAENLGVDDIADNTDKTMRYLSVNRLPGSAAAGVQDLIQKEKDFKTYSQYRKYHDIMVLGKNRTGTTDYDNEINELATKISNMEGKYNGFHDAITTPAGLATINQNSSEQDVQTVTNAINAYTTTILTNAEKTTIKSHNAANEGATGADAIAIGYDAKSAGAQAVSLGKAATASGENAIAIGNNAQASSSQITVSGTTRNSTSAIAIGVGAKAKADAAMSLGVFSNTTVTDGVALGSNSTADRASIVNNKTNAYNGSDTNVADTIKGTYGAVSVGNSDNTRQIINVAAGSADTDAVNVAQLKNNSFNVKVKDGTSSAIKSGKTVEFASAGKYLKISHTAETNGNSNFTFDVDENELKKTIGATSTGDYLLEFSGDTASTKIIRDKTNKELKIKGGVTTTTDLSTNNIGVEADTTTGTLNIKLAKALKGLTSAEFKNTAGDTTTVNGDGVSYNKADNLDTNGAVKDPKQTVSLGKDGINAGGKTISNVGEAQKDTDAVSKKQAETIADKAVEKLTGNIADGTKVYFNAEADDTATTGSKKVANTKNIKFEGDDNVKTSIEQATDGSTTTVKFTLNTKDLNLGGKNGANGTDGKIAVNGADGKSGVAINGKDGTIGAKGEDGKDGVVINGDDHTIIAKGKDGKDGVIINGKDGTIGLPGKDGTSASGVVIKGGDGVNGVDGTSITRIVYTENGKEHKLATLDDGIKFLGNNGDKALKLNKQFTIQGADANKDTGAATTIWDTFDAGTNIMTKAEADGENGKLTIALAKALKGLTSAEFKNTAGDTTTVNGDGVSYNKADNLDTNGAVKDPKQTVSLGKDGINAGGKTISNVGEAQKDTDAVSKGQLDAEIKKNVAANGISALKFSGDSGNTNAVNSEIKFVGGQTDTKKLSDNKNIGVVAKDGKLDIKLAKDIEVDSVTAKNKITVGEGANKITIADGKISGITSAVDPNGELANKLKAIDNDVDKTDAVKAADKKAAIKDALDKVDNGNVATVGDLKNVTNGLDSVVENVTNITKNVTSITNNVNNITNITNMVANSGDKGKIDEAAKAIDGYKKDPNDKNKKAAEVAIKANKIKTYNPYETTVKNNTTIVEAIQNMNERGIKFIHVSDSDKVGEGDDVTLVSDDSRANQKGSIGIGMNAASTAENAIATGTKSEASGADSIATGTDSKASGTNAIAMGTGAQAMGENTISIGTGNKVIGKHSGAIGDPTTLNNVNGVYSMGNDNFIQGGGEAAAADKTARDIFAIGNNIGSVTKKVTDKANGSVILGSNGYSNVTDGVALGYGSNADRQALKSDNEKKSVYNGNDEGVRNTIKGNYGAVSVGDKDNTRQIINVAAGSADSDAVNVAQLKAATSKIMASTGGVSMSNLTIDPKTGKKVTIADGNRANYAPKVTKDGVNSVAIGANSVANRANTVSVGSAGNERIIANVADGVAPTDAANMRQLQSVANMVGEVKKDAMAGTASAMAIGNLPQATIPGKGMMAIGAGYYKGQTATALGVSKMSENGRWVFKASASYDSQRNVGAAGAVGFHF